MKRLQVQEARNEAELIQRCGNIEGLNFSQLASELGLAIPQEINARKGWLGMAVELALGATAGTQSIPDFYQLGIELKTLPINHLGKPAESTFITSIPLLTIHQQIWKNSQCYAKLKKILWLPVEGDRAIPFELRRIGRGFLWSPSPEEEKILEEDWTLLSFMISTGQLEELDATIGEYLQVRPKAANAKSLCYGFDNQGNKILTLPRGFYLRTYFTMNLLKDKK